MDPQKRPSFIDSWLTDVQEDYRRYGARSLVPWWALGSICIGAGISLLVPKERFWDHSEISVVFFTAAVTINGLLLALSWSSFAKIYELASEPKMASFLRRHDLLKSYIFQVDFIHIAQIAALMWSGAALILCVIDHLPYVVSDFAPLLILQKISFAGSIASTLYALKYAHGAVQIMQDLVWYSAFLPDEGSSERSIVVHEGGRDR